jgi:hypothetical protein
MKISAQAAGGIADEDYLVLEAGFSEDDADSELSMMF